MLLFRICSGLQCLWKIANKKVLVNKLVPFYLAGAVGFEPTTNGFGDHYSTVEPYPFEQYILYTTFKKKARSFFKKIKFFCTRMHIHEK